MGGAQGTTNGNSGTGNSRSELNILSGATGQTPRDIQQRSVNVTGAGSRSELNAQHRLSAAPLSGQQNQKTTSLFLNGNQQRTDLSNAAASSYQPSPYMMTSSSIGQRNLEVLAMNKLIFFIKLKSYVFYLSNVSKEIHIIYLCVISESTT